MEFWSFIRNIFGGQNLEQPRYKGFFYHPENYNDGDNFNSSVWQNDLGDSGINDRDYRLFKGNDHFHIFSDPLEMAKYFEFQMDNMLKTFIFGFNSDDSNMNALPFQSPERGDLRNKMLKPNSDEELPKLDTDLDGKVTVDNFSNIWNDHVKPKAESSLPRITGKFFRKQYIRKPDGTIEEKQVIKDYEGNEETIISQRIGDKIHTIVTKKDKNGTETKSEEFVNMTEGESDGNRRLPFSEKNDSHEDLNHFPWKKFFDFDPKL